jgi:hypothetical protein
MKRILLLVLIIAILFSFTSSHSTEVDEELDDFDEDVLENKVDSNQCSIKAGYTLLPSDKIIDQSTGLVRTKKSSEMKSTAGKCFYTKDKQKQVVCTTKRVLLPSDKIIDH